MVEAAAPAPVANKTAFKDKEKPTEVRLSNIVAAKGTLSLLCVLMNAFGSCG